MNRTLRLRLTLWYLALFSVLFALFGGFLYGVLSSALRDRLDSTLRSEASTAAGLFQDELDEARGDVPRAAVETVNEMQVKDTVVAIFQEGRLLASSATVAQVSDLPTPGQVGDLPHYGSHEARAAVVSAGQVRVAVIGPLDSIAAELALVRRALWISIPLILLLTGFGGYALAARGLAPLYAMARQSREITGSSLHKRLDIGGAAAELLLLAASFNELLARLDQSFASMRRFVADASHELRTPISVIRGEADVALSQERSAAEYRESLGIILEESRRLSRLVDDLLNLARADSGHVKLRNAELYLNDLLAECCRSAQPLAAARGLMLECRAGGDAPFQGDEELLRRMIMNLLDNGVRYTPKGGRVSATLETEDAVFRLRVSDTGQGIPPEAAGRIFERFYRVDEARSRQNGGFGLGLSIVQWIAEAHHGKVELASQPGAGSVFTVTLPR